MDILFLQSIWFEFLGSMSLMATIRMAGFKADLVIGNDKTLLQAVMRNKPKIVAFSCVTGIHGWALNLCKLIKTSIDPSIRTLMGGPHPTFFPEILDENRNCLDFICVGEGEEAILELLQTLENPLESLKIQNLHINLKDQVIKNPIRPLISDLDSLPFLDRQSYYKYKILRENPVKLFITGRGCPNACAFCFNHSAMQLYRGKGPYVRKRSVENVIAEIDQVVSNYPVKTVRFEDDLFGVRKDWLLEFCEAYPRKFKKPFICFMRADVIDREVTSALKTAGCYNVVIGVETGDERFRNETLRKNISDEQLHIASSLFHDYGIQFCTTNILGLPGETIDLALKTITFNLKLKPTFTWVSIFQPYPRTELGREVLEKNLVDSLHVDEIDPNYHSNSVLRQPDIHRSVNLHMFFYLIFSFPVLLPVFKILSSLPCNIFFKMIHRISFLFIYSRRWNISLFRAIQEALRATGFTRKISSKDRSETC